MHSTHLLDLSGTVNDIVERFPATLSILNSVGIDACCGGALPLATVAEKHRIDLQVLRSALENAIREGETAA